MIAVLDYDAGNLTSMRLALEHVGAGATVVRDAEAAMAADRIVFPGVGSAAACMRRLRERGFDLALRDAAARGKPTLAVCIGMQLLYEASDEDGGVAALGMLPGRIVHFAFPPGAGVKVPHMGWNSVEAVRPHPLLRNMRRDEAFYFVHSYHAAPELDASAPAGALVHGVSEYAGLRFASMVGFGSFFAVQFHPERSGEAGLDLLRAFAAWDGQPC